MLRAGLFDHHTTDPYIVATAAGATVLAQGFWGPCPQGYAWYVERISTHGPTANTKLDVYVTTSSIVSGVAASDDGFRADFTATANDAIVPEELQRRLFHPERWHSRRRRHLYGGVPVGGSPVESACDAVAGGPAAGARSPRVESGCVRVAAGRPAGTGFA